MAATRKRAGAVKKAAPKKATKKAAPPKKQPTPKQKAVRARANRESQNQKSVIAGEVGEGETLTSVVGEDAAKRIRILQAMLGYEDELDVVRVKGAIMILADQIATSFDDWEAQIQKEVERKPGAGKPTSYDPSWMLVVVLCLMGDGASKVELAAALGITERTLYDWVNADGDVYKPIFARVIDMGETLSHGWWQRSGRQNLGNKSFNYVGWYMNMKNRFGWRDRHELSGDENNPIQISGTLTYSTDWDKVRDRVKKTST